MIPCLRRRRWWGVAASTLLVIAALTVPLFLAKPDDWFNFLDENRVAEPGPGQRSGVKPRVPTSAWIVAVSLVLIALPTPYALFDPNPKFWTAAEKMAIQWAKPIPTLIMYTCGLAWLLGDGIDDLDAVCEDDAG